jgi:hypothetical protein
VKTVSGTFLGDVAGGGLQAVEAGQVVGLDGGHPL